MSVKYRTVNSIYSFENVIYKIASVFGQISSSYNDMHKKKSFGASVTGRGWKSWSIYICQPASHQ